MKIKEKFDTLANMLINENYAVTKTFKYVKEVDFMVRFDHSNEYDIKKMTSYDFNVEEDFIISSEEPTKPFTISSYQVITSDCQVYGMDIAVADDGEVANVQYYDLVFESIKKKNCKVEVTEFLNSRTTMIKNNTKNFKLLWKMLN